MQRMSMGVARGGDWLFDEYQHVFDGQKPFHAVDTNIARMFIRERAIKEALGRWVSELEPALAFNNDGHFTGLCLAGAAITDTVAILVPIRGGVPI